MAFPVADCLTEMWFVVVHYVHPVGSNYPVDGILVGGVLTLIYRLYVFTHLPHKSFNIRLTFSRVQCIISVSRSNTRRQTYGNTKTSHTTREHPPL
jgi:hypothetical protein